MTTLFISDLHLCKERPHVNALFGQFAGEVAAGANALYILGDLFEYWIGDDQLDHDPLAREVASTLAGIAGQGTKIFFMHGNRDFLIGERFAAAARLTLLPDPTLVRQEDMALLLMHGDTLCTDDVAYQQFRAQVRNTTWQSGILGRPYAERVELARTLRSQSDLEKSLKADAIMDVNVAAVASALAAHQYPVLIHGHTHRPARHHTQVDGHACTRWVLPDWRETGGYLAIKASEPRITAHTIGGAAPL